MNSKLEHLQLMQKLSMIGIPLFLVLSAICGFGWNHYGLKIKEEEIRISKENAIKNQDTKVSPKVYNTEGDHFRGDKTIDNSVTSIQDNSKNKQENTNSGTNTGNIGGTGNTVSNNPVTNNYTNSGINHGIIGPVNVNPEKQLKDIDKKNILIEVEKLYEKFPELEKSFIVMVDQVSNSGSIPEGIRVFLKENGYGEGSIGMRVGPPIQGIHINKVSGFSAQNGDQMAIYVGTV